MFLNPDDWEEYRCSIMEDDESDDSLVKLEADGPCVMVPWLAVTEQARFVNDLISYVVELVLLLKNAPLEPANPCCDDCDCWYCDVKRSLAKCEIHRIGECWYCTASDEKEA